MKKILIPVLIISLFILYTCSPEDPAAPKLSGVTQNQLLLSKMVALGNSLTAGFQSSGLMEDFQLHSYPYLIAQQMGKAAVFEQPIVDDPGIGNPSGKTPLYINSEGDIVQDDLTVSPLTLLSNATLARPYDNLGVPGANTYDMMNTTSGGMFDLVLRNPNLANTTQVEQAIMLQPTLILLWIGNNDVLGAALYGTAVTGVTITPQNQFESSYTAIIDALQENTNAHIVIANIPYVSDIPFVNTIPPAILDSANNPIAPYLTEEDSVQYVLLTAKDSLDVGVGIPVSLGGTDRSLPGSLTLTYSEVATIKSAVDGFNSFLGQLALSRGLMMVNINQVLTDLNEGDYTGLSGQFVSLAPTNTVYSLDGVHPNNAGYALIANEFIKVINAATQLGIQEIDATTYAGQYISALTRKLSYKSKAFIGVKKLFK